MLHHVLLLILAVRNAVRIASVGRLLVVVLEGIELISGDRGSGKKPHPQIHVDLSSKLLTQPLCEITAVSHPDYFLTPPF